MAANTSLHHELRAIARLADDQTPAVQQAIEQRLQEIGRPALPILYELQEEGDNLQRSAVRDAAHRLHMKTLLQAWTHVLDADEVDLERGAFLLALYRFPTLDMLAYQAKLDRMARAFNARLSVQRGPERAFALADFFSDTLGFHGNREHFYDPANSFLNRVIDERKGIPISLAVIFLLIGWRANLPVYGVNMPKRFLVKYQEAGTEVFFDLYHGGEHISQEACVQFLLQEGIKPHRKFFEPAPPRLILARMLRNLRLIAEQHNEEQLREDLQRLSVPLEADVP